MKSKGLVKAWSIFSTVIVVLVVIIALVLMGARVLGMNVYSVISGSMEPEYKVGDLIYVKEVEPEKIKVGDTITFVLNENLQVATHRVVEIDKDTEHFWTKGDANEHADKVPVHFNNLIGKPVFKIPYLGYVSDWIQNPPGTYIAIVIGVALVLLAFVPGLFIKDDEDEEKSEQTKKESVKEDPKTEKSAPSDDPVTPAESTEDKTEEDN